MDRRKFMGTMATVTVAGAAGLHISQMSQKYSEMKKNTIPKRLLGKTGVEVSCLIIGGVSGMMALPTKRF